ncbi:hypothetical protein F7230_00555 [Corynebacterium sp. 320]|uniref:DUF4178 domain-containing protein n=1 Tax=Corynebacterium zhongnanshanii TaxID=2768834 RepID=A0ABQ6VK23_9CORY|nr:MULTISPECIES: hypothetical protein [Corynebacterium]KAB1503658.1 hypothetical protein F7230_00555 [Corynebacterium sp. 320]KAB1553241.1 hypothetical protein F7233_06035 [Corynebacterium sp. 321]KAB1553540.1 hypothetical protein F7232_00550 [Corynebacterium sp. 319]KAB3523491.1 hypothetical protein F8377_05085 [Corynebacterium zhongnanshanii]KAB3527794.1 hypothetical protein F8354_00555 [Corynebacterium sp. 250]
MKVFDYAHASTTHGQAEEALAQPSVLASISSPREGESTDPRQTGFTEALASHGQLPVPRPVAGVGVGRGLCLLGAAGCVIWAVAVGLAGNVLLAVAVGVIAVALLAGVAVSHRAYRRRVALVERAWDNGWVRFAPARVGAVWVSHMSHHQGTKALDQDTRYYFQARVQVCSAEGEELFQFDSAPFSAPADRNGVPLDLHTAPTPLDLLEPEAFNGWTVARWIDGHEEHTATIATGLTRQQICAGLTHAGVR